MTRIPEGVPEGGRKGGPLSQKRADSYVRCSGLWLGHRQSGEPCRRKARGNILFLLLLIDPLTQYNLSQRMGGPVGFLLGGPLSELEGPREEWHPTPVLLPGKSHGWRSLVGCSPWGRKESNTTERLDIHFSLSLSPGTGEPGGLPSMGSHRVGHD